MQSLQSDSIADILLSLLEKSLDFEPIDFVFTLLRTLKRSQNLKFNNFANHIIQSPQMTIALTKWINGFGLECVSTAKFIANNLEIESNNDFFIGCAIKNIFFFSTYNSVWFKEFKMMLKARFDEMNESSRKLSMLNEEYQIL